MIYDDDESTPMHFPILDSDRPIPPEAYEEAAALPAETLAALKNLHGTYSRISLPWGPYRYEEELALLGHTVSADALRVLLPQLDEASTQG
ncbi:hypothetical protein ACU635_43620 [[Actinomadura] parvosata]|uniref:hypothetical protein n=1 Tax=[Actinomadura] parvosata TaxID=1955412 RepID=UPI00406C2695